MLATSLDVPQIKKRGFRTCVEPRHWMSFNWRNGGSERVTSSNVLQLKKRGLKTRVGPRHWMSSDSRNGGSEHVSRHVIGCPATQETGVQNACRTVDGLLVCIVRLSLPPSPLRL